MSTSTDPKRFAPAADLVPVQEVIVERGEGDGAIAVMKDGSFRMILRTGTVNFDMKSPPEREGITTAFGELVNSLDPSFPIQIVSHSKQLDTEAYVRQFEGRLNNANTPPQLRGLIKAHIEHFEHSVKAQNLLQRELYVVVPWKKTGGPVTESVTNFLPFGRLISQVGKIMEKKVIKQVEVTPQQIHDARRELTLRTDEIIGRLFSMGIWARRLDADDLRKMLYETYHPGLSQIHRNPNLDVAGLASGFSGQGIAVPRRPLANAPAALNPARFDN